jgi:RNA polymerase sigma factor (sigma-70 family)
MNASPEIWHTGPALEDDASALLLSAKSGDSMAQAAFVRHYTPWVRRLAYIYKGNLSLEDATQEGLIGLMKALEKYDPKRAIFKTHARWWVRAAITRAVENTSAIIHVPARVIQQRARIRHLVDAYLDKGGAQPSAKEIARLTGLSCKRIAVVMEGGAIGTVSLDGPVGGADGRPFHETLADPSSDVDPMHLADFEVFLSHLERLMKSYAYGEYWTVLLEVRSGETTFASAAKERDITRETARRKTFRALRVALQDPKCRQFFLEAGVSEAILANELAVIDKFLSRANGRK